MSLRAIFSLLILLSCAPAFAEFSCASDISYKWRAKAGDSATTASNTAPAQAVTPPAEVSPPGEIEVFWASIEATADTEENAKVKLADLVNKERTKTDASCQDAHENQTKCISGKYAQNASVMSTMSFSQRKDFEKTISGDCTALAGHCLGSKVSEAKCREIKKADDAAAGKDGSADKKGKDTKKK